MSNAAGDHLSPLDALFVYLEKKEMPLHIGSVGIFDGPISMSRLKAAVEAKLPLIPRYRQRLVFPPLHIGLPTWEWDHEFDIDRHFSRTRLKQGTERELEALAGEHFAKMMDRQRPLWDILVVDGLKGRRSALMIRVHHCLVDGIAGVALMNILLDQSPMPARLPKKQPFHPPPLPDTGKRFVDALVNAYEEFTNRLLAAQSEVLNVAQAMLGQPPLDSLDQFPGAVPFASVERLPFNKPVLGPRQFAWTDLPLAEIKAVREVLGGTLNDVVLMLVTSAVRRYSEYHGESMQGRIFRMMVPVNLRRDVINPGVGNSISFVPVNVPLDIPDPVELLHAVHRITESVKRAHLADVITLTAKWLGAAPAPFQVAFGLLGNNLPLPPWNMVCTNVPGPQVPLYALGRRLLTAYPYVPIGNEMGVNCAVESYNGNLYINFAGDTAAAPDLGRMRDFLVDSFRQLKAKAAAAAAVEEEPSEPVRAAKRPARPRAEKKRTAPAAAPPEAAVEKPPEPVQVQKEPARPRAAKKRATVGARPESAPAEPATEAVAEPAVEAVAEAAVEKPPEPVQVQKEPARPRAAKKRATVAAGPESAASEPPVETVAEPAVEAVAEPPVEKPPEPVQVQKEPARPRAAKKRATVAAGPESAPAVEPSVETVAEPAVEAVAEPPVEKPPEPVQVQKEPARPRAAKKRATVAAGPESAPAVEPSVETVAEPAVEAVAEPPVEKPPEPVQVQKEPARPRAPKKRATVAAGPESAPAVEPAVEAVAEPAVEAVAEAAVQKPPEPVQVQKEPARPRAAKKRATVAAGPESAPAVEPSVEAVAEPPVEKPPAPVQVQKEPARPRAAKKRATVAAGPESAPAVEPSVETVTEPAVANPAEPAPPVKAEKKPVRPRAPRKRVAAAAGGGNGSAPVVVSEPPETVAAVPPEPEPDAITAKVAGA